MSAKYKENQGPRFTRYTPLNTDRGRILDEALSAELIPTPRRAMSLDSADRTRKWKYHQNSGHKTKEC